VRALGMQLLERKLAGDDKPKGPGIIA